MRNQAAATEHLDTEHQLTNRFAWVFALTYATAVGWAWPAGVQVLLLSIISFSGLYLLLRPQAGNRLRLLMVSAAGTLNGAAFVLTSNHRILALNWLAGLFLLSLLLLTLYRRGQWPETFGEYCSDLIYFFVAFLDVLFLFRLKDWLAAQGPRERWIGPRLGQYHLAAAFWAVLVFVVFHILLSQVNQDYADFVAEIVDGIWAALRYLWQLDIVVILLQAAIIAYAQWVFLTKRAARGGTSRPQDGKQRLQLLLPALATLILILAVFSLFQGRLLFINPASLPYRELALYVQRGFWQLLMAAGLGFVFWNICAAIARREQNTGRRICALLLVLAAELLLLSLFSQHKLLIQQVAFGFRDERVMASCGVLLVSLTFVLLIAHAAGRVTVEMIFRAQYAGLVLVVLVLSFANLDLFITRHNSIRFVHNGRMYKDYAYLLTNSYDNWSAWLDLMDEAERTGIPVPSDYYWGEYKPLCIRTAHNRYLNGMRLWQAKLLAHGRQGVRGILASSWPHYRAARLVRENEERILRFIHFVDAQCEDVQRAEVRLSGL